MDGEFYAHFKFYNALEKLGWKWVAKEDSTRNASQTQNEEEFTTKRAAKKKRRQARRKGEVTGEEKKKKNKQEMTKPEREKGTLDGQFADQKETWSGGSNVDMRRVAGAKIKEGGSNKYCYSCFDNYDNDNEHSYLMLMRTEGALAHY